MASAWLVLSDRFQACSSPPHILCAAHHGVEDLVVVLATAQVSRDAVCEFSTRGIWICLQEADRRHDEAGHAEGALEALFVNHRLLHGVELAIRARQSFNGDRKSTRLNSSHLGIS